MAHRPNARDEAAASRDVYGISVMSVKATGKVECPRHTRSNNVHSSNVSDQQRMQNARVREGGKGNEDVGGRVNR